MTPSAVSHGIRTLEDWLGTPLFHRGSRGLVTTQAAEELYPQVHQALMLLANAAARVPGRKTTGTLAISVAPTFASRWLMPRLKEFRELHPDIRITLDTSQRYVEFPIDGMDLAIRMCRAKQAGEDWTHLIRENLVPVCAPTLAGKDGQAHWPAFLGKTPLIHVTRANEDWDVWLREQDLSAAEQAGQIRVDTVQAAIDAAVHGLGVALGRRPLVDCDLDSGRLVPIGPETNSTTSYWLVGLDKEFERPEVKEFRRWIVSESGAERSICAEV